MRTPMAVGRRGGLIVAPAATLPQWLPSTFTVPLLMLPLFYVQAIRLPPGARLLSAEPKPREVRSKGARTSVIWTGLLAPRVRFRSMVEYQLD